MGKRDYDLLDRLVQFVLQVDEVEKKLPQTSLMKNIGSQLIRCASSTSLNYSESISAESGKDFIHKLKIVLKELRESYTCLEIIRKNTSNSKIEPELDYLLKENDELKAIFYTSIQTARENAAKNKNNKR